MIYFLIKKEAIMTLSWSEYSYKALQPSMVWTLNHQQLEESRQYWRRIEQPFYAKYGYGVASGFMGLGPNMMIGGLFGIIFNRGQNGSSGKVVYQFLRNPNSSFNISIIPGIASFTVHGFGPKLMTICCLGPLFEELRWRTLQSLLMAGQKKLAAQDPEKQSRLIQTATSPMTAVALVTGGFGLEHLRGRGTPLIMRISQVVGIWMRPVEAWIHATTESPGAAATAHIVNNTAAMALMMLTARK
jgi:hypothetical protein